MDKGISERHARACPANDGGRCACEPTFRAQVYDAGTGKQIVKSFPTITGARRWRQDAYAALRAGTLTAGRGPTVEAAAAAWLDAARAGVVRNRSGEAYKPSAIRGYEQNLSKRVLPALAQERLRELTLPQLQRLVDRLAAEGVAAATITATITPLRAIYRRSRQLGEVQTNPTSGLSVPAVNRRQTRFATSEQIDAVLVGLERPKDRALWATALYAGLRRGELQALHRENVDLATGVIRVERGWDAEEGRCRRSQSKVGARCRSLRCCATGGGVPDERTRDRAHLRRHPRQLRPGRAAAVAGGVERPTLHECRHGYAAMMIAAGVNVKALSTFMGHANIGITLDQYGHLLPGAEDEAAGLLDEFLARQAGEGEDDREYTTNYTAPSQSRF